ncbi:MAG: hypothetical protein EOO62_04715 [Hymenobacter sp.]|nr:MAG: hypothetical protein EOO62_04715 [Hymenobacter sp.]
MKSGWLFLLISTLFISRPACAQTSAARARNSTLLDVSGRAGPSLNQVAVAGWRLWGVGPNGRLQVGVGLRGRLLFAIGDPYVGQDTPNSQSGARYTLSVPAHQVLALNTALHMRLRVVGPVRLGAVVDVAGLSFGPAFDGIGLRDGLVATLVHLRPERYNLQLGDAHAHGTLASEWYVAVDLPHAFGLRVGYAHVVTARTADEPREYAGRYQSTDNQFIAGVTYTLP